MPGQTSTSELASWRDRVIGLEYHKPEEILDHPHQWRGHPKLQLEALRGVLGKVGVAGALLVYHSPRAAGALVSIDGHGRKSLDPAHPWPCLMLDVTDEEADLLLATFDPLGGLATIDRDKLKELLESIRPSDAMIEAVLAKLAKDAALDRLDASADPGPQIDRAAELQEEWGTALGQLWQIGGHRLLCGDSTKPEDVLRVLAGERPLLMVTDPPYGVDYDPNWRSEEAAKGTLSYAARRLGEVENDDRVDWSEAWLLFPGEVFYCWHAGRHASAVQRSMEAAGFEVRSQIVWAKSNFPISRGHYHWRHEPCWYAVRKGAQAHWIGDRTQTTVWDIDLDCNVEGGHSTQKPLECMARPIRNHDSDLVYDPFLGSGTTMVACQLLGRRCLAIEISPAYVAVALERLAGMGLEPGLVE